MNNKKKRYTYTDEAKKKENPPSDGKRRWGRELRLDSEKKIHLYLALNAQTIIKLNIHVY